MKYKVNCKVKSESHCTYMMHFSMWVWQKSAAAGPPCPSYTAKYRTSSVSWALTNRSSFSFRLPMCEAQPTFSRLILGIGLPYLMLGGSRMGSSMRLSQIPKLSQVAGRPLPSRSNREHLGSEVELWQVGVSRLSSCSRRELSSTLLLTWLPPLLTKVIKAAVDITQLQRTQEWGNGQ